MFPVAAAYSLPPGLQASTDFSTIMAHAELSLLATFGDALHIIRSPVLLQHFLSLPQPCLLALLQSPGLTTDSEESVLLLLSSWLEQPVGQLCSTEQVLELNSLIRYSRLSRPYLTGLCDSLQLPQLTRAQLLELSAFCSLRTEQFWGTETHNNPQGWYSQPRPTPTPHESGVRLSMVVAEAELARLLAALESDRDVSPLETQAVYAEGFLWTLDLHVSNQHLWCTVKARGLKSIQSMDQGLTLAHAVPRALTIQIDAPEPLIISSSTYIPVHTKGAGVRLAGVRSDFSESAHMDWWAKYVVDGCVRLSAVTKAVDS